MKALLTFVLSLALALSASAQIYGPSGGHGGKHGGGQTTVVVANGGDHHRGDCNRGSGSTTLGFVAGALFGAVAVQSQGSYYSSPSYQTSTNYGYSSSSANYGNYQQPTPVPVTYYVAPAAPVYAAGGGYPVVAGSSGGGAYRLAEQDVETARQQYVAAQQEFTAAQERLEYAAAKYRAASAAAGSLR